MSGFWTGKVTFACAGEARDDGQKTTFACAGEARSAVRHYANGVYTGYLGG